MSVEVNPGWYVDPENSQQFRYWDGNKWTDAVAPNNSNAEESVTENPDAQRSLEPQGTSGGENLEQKNKRVIFPSEIILSKTELPSVEIDISKGPQEAIDNFKKWAKYDDENHYWTFEYTIDTDFYYKINKNLIKRPIKVLAYRDLDKKDLIKFYFEGLGKINEDFVEEILREFIFDVNGTNKKLTENTVNLTNNLNRSENDFRSLLKNNIFSKAFKHVFKNYFNFSGRTPRRYFWLWEIFPLLIFYVIGILFGNYDEVIQFLSILVALLLVPINVGLVIRRFHDLNKSGFYILLLLVPIVNVAIIIYLFFWPSFKESNKYGEVVV